MKKIPVASQETLSIDEVTDHLLESAKSFIDTDPDQAVAFLDKALSISRNADSSSGIAKSLLHLAQLSSKKGNGQERIRLLVEAAQYFEKSLLLSDSCSCYRHIAEAYCDNGGYRDALESLGTAFRLAKSSGDLVAQGEILNRTGEICKLLEQYEQAIEYHLRALEIVEITGSKELLSETYCFLGYCYTLSGEPDTAFSYLDKSLTLAEDTGSPALQARPAGGLGIIFNNLGNTEKALEYFFRAIDHASNGGDLILKTDLLKNASRVYLKNGENDKALSFLKEALLLSETYSLSYPVHEIHRLLSEAYFHTSDFKDAYEHLELFHNGFEKQKQKELSSMVQGLQLKSELEDTRKGKVMAEQAASHQDRLLLNIGHEVRTPLNGVIGMADLLIGTHPTPEQLEYINTIKLSAGNLIQIIDDIIEYNSLQAGTRQVKNEPVNIRILVRELAGTHLERAGVKGLKLIYEVSEDVPEGLNGDQGLIRELLDKLVDNAVKFTTRGTVKIEVSQINTRPVEPLLLFTVSDSGSGIAPEKIDSIFEWQPVNGDHLYRAEGGIGLSLPLVKKITGLLGGTIQVTSQPGSGSIFKVSLPLFIRKRSKGADKSGVIKKTVTTETPVLRILMVEDNKVNQFLAQKLLTKMGFSVSLASNASEAVDALQSEQFDVILMDVQMPVMTGYELTELIRTTLEPPVNSIPIIALTAYASLQEKEKALACGMNDYVTKPYSPEELRSVLLRVAEQARKTEDVSSESVTPQEAAASVERLLALFSGNKEDVVSLLNMLIVQIPQLLQEAGKQIETNDWSGSFHTFHKIKSSINLLKIRTLRNRIAELEEFSKDQIHAARIPQLFSLFRKSCETVVGLLKEEIVRLRKN